MRRATHFDFVMALGSFLTLLAKYKPKQWNTLEQVYGSPIDIANIQPSDVVMSPDDSDGETAYIEYGRFRFFMELKAPSTPYQGGTLTSGVKTDNNTDYLATVLVMVDGKHVTSDSGWFTSRGFEHLYYPTHDEEMIDDFIQRQLSFLLYHVLGHIRNKTSAIIRGHRRYLEDAKEYDRLEKVLNLKVKV